MTTHSGRSASKLAPVPEIAAVRNRNGGRLRGEAWTAEVAEVYHALSRGCSIVRSMWPDGRPRRSWTCWPLLFDGKHIEMVILVNVIWLTKVLHNIWSVVLHDEIMTAYAYPFLSVLVCLRLWVRWTLSIINSCILLYVFQDHENLYKLTMRNVQPFHFGSYVWLFCREGNKLFIPHSLRRHDKKGNILTCTLLQHVRDLRAQTRVSSHTPVHLQAQTRASSCTKPGIHGELYGRAILIFWIYSSWM